MYFFEGRLLKSIVGKSDFASGIRFFGEYLSEFSGVFFRFFFWICVEYFSECWVFFRILNKTEVRTFFLFLFGLTSILPNFPGYFLVLCIFPSFIVFTDFNSTFEVFFRVLSIFPNFARKKAGSWILGSRFFPTMASVRLQNCFAQFLQPALEATNWTLCVNRSSKVRGKTSLAW